MPSEKKTILAVLIIINFDLYKWETKATFLSILFI